MTTIEEEVPDEVKYEEDVIEDHEVEEDVVQKIRVPQVKVLYKYKGQGLGIEKGEVRVVYISDTYGYQEYRECILDVKYIDGIFIQLYNFVFLKLIVYTEVCVCVWDGGEADRTSLHHV